MANPLFPNWSIKETGLLAAAAWAAEPPNGKLKPKAIGYVGEHEDELMNADYLEKNQA